jgi:rubrerythrin
MGVMDIGRDSDAFQRDVLAEAAVGTNNIVWRCGTCEALIQQSDLMVSACNNTVVHHPPEACPHCGAVCGFQLIDED